MFSANGVVFDSGAIGSELNYDEMIDQVGRLAEKIVRNYALGRGVDNLVEGFYNSQLGKAQAEAFVNAVSLDKHPTLTRSMVGETCGWCAERVGTFVYPRGDLFARHDNCDCLLVVSGYNSRNGVVTNYKKGGTRTSAVRAGINNPFFTVPITQEDYVADIFGDIRPGVGREIVVEKSRGRRIDDIAMAEFLKRRYGGDYTVMSDINPDNTKSPDLLLSNKAIFEIKNISSYTSVDSQVRKAIKQLDKQNLLKLRSETGNTELRKVIILDVDKRFKIDVGRAEDIIRHRMDR